MTWHFVPMMQYSPIHLGVVFLCRAHCIFHSRFFVVAFFTYTWFDKIIFSVSSPNFTSQNEKNENYIAESKLFVVINVTKFEKNVVQLCK